MAIHLLWQILQNKLSVLFFLIFFFSLSDRIFSVINVFKIIDVCAAYVFVCDDSYLYILVFA